MKKNIITKLVLLFLLLNTALFAVTQWPREMVVDGTSIVVYQPQPEELKGNTIKARAAISVKAKEQHNPIFASIWFTGRLHVDKTDNSAYVNNLTLLEVRFPKNLKTKAKHIESLIKKQIKDKKIDISYSRLLASLNEIKKRDKNLNKVKVSPPVIWVENRESILVKIDGEARWIKVDDKLNRVDNTKFKIYEYTPTKMHYVLIDEHTWYQSKALDGKWKIASDMPDEITAKAPKLDALLAQTSEESDEDAKQVIVTTQPSVLITYTKEPDFVPIDDTGLLYMSNTQSDLFMEISSQTYFLVINGRWYKSKELDKDWDYVASDKLPDDFKNIPVVSEKAEVRYFVAGTQEAKDAVLDAQVPQTTQIDRKNASLKVKYNGKPKLEPIKGTAMNYIANTATPVIKVGKYYYACDNAVWFVSTDPEGHWKVASSVPDVIYTIPPDSFLYYVTFVHVYEADDKTVWTGYTPGYTGTYVQYSTVVYGTGFYYPGYYGGYYYDDRDLGYYALARHNQRRNAIDNAKGNISDRRDSLGDNLGNNRGNIYKNPENRGRIKQNLGNRDSKLAQSIKGKNNVFADREGNIHKRTDKGWSSRNGGSGKLSNKANSGGWKSASRFNGNMAKNSRMNNSFSSRNRGSMGGGGFSHRGGGGLGHGSMMHRGGGGRRR